MSIHTPRKKMITEDISDCPYCKIKLKKYDKVKRIVKSERGAKSFIYLNRSYCHLCGRVYRVLPDLLIPYKHYERRIIFGVLTGLYTSAMEEYEDYPCEMTMLRWKKELA